ncbi:hypothetical protein CLV70_1841 [Pseudosporangium ferrugineum]|uniref:Uncharacterized protein n=1 Tax=Pseudosporangium ferrugineum TaxID=439699 RepID=A0A2T0QYE8_9ACTN|nr:hypothetical protein CLV70_1841 [Pseudosporangium ferrugineum]
MLICCQSYTKCFYVRQFDGSGRDNFDILGRVPTYLVVIHVLFSHVYTTSIPQYSAARFMHPLHEVHGGP